MSYWPTPTVSTVETFRQSRRGGTGPRRRGRGPSILDRHDDHALFVLEKDVHEKHPPPRTEDKPERAPTTRELWAELGKASKRRQALPNAPLGVSGERMRSNKAIKIGHSRDAELDARHAL